MSNQIISVLSVLSFYIDLSTPIAEICGKAISIVLPDDLLTGEKLVAVDEDAGDVAEEKDKDDADENRSQVDLLLH